MSDKALREIIVIAANALQKEAALGEEEAEELEHEGEDEGEEDDEETKQIKQSAVDLAATRKRTSG